MDVRFEPLKSEQRLDFSRDEVLYNITVLLAEFLSDNELPVIA